MWLHPHPGPGENKTTLQGTGESFLGPVWVFVQLLLEPNQQTYLGAAADLVGIDLARVKSQALFNVMGCGVTSHLLLCRFGDSCERALEQLQDWHHFWEQPLLQAHH